MRQYYLCRHGQTEWNLLGRKQGQQDSPLTAEGVRQAHELARLFKPLPNAALFASTLGRAVQTARIIREENPRFPLQTDRRLREIGFGELEGRTKARIAQDHARVQAAFEADPLMYRFPGGESYQDVGERVRDFLNDLRRDFADVETIIIVAHENVNHVLLSELLSIGLAETVRCEQSNDRVYRIVDGTARILCLPSERLP
jgi:probable phosphoglycerate mutase